MTMMTSVVLILLLPLVSCFVIRQPHQKRMNSPEDVPILLNVMNQGKSALQLQTENTNEILKVIQDMESPGSVQDLFKNHNFNNLMQDASANLASQPDEQKTLALSGTNQDMHVDKNKEIDYKTPTDAMGKHSPIGDDFKMVLENVPYQNANHKKDEKIMIEEKDKIISGKDAQFKDSMDFPDATRLIRVPLYRAYGRRIIKRQKSSEN